MIDLFLNPWAMAAGSLLVSSPIIIHLINRTRFKRIRWAAMEFLLKSQKRTRRKMIIEQLLLLLMRIMLVLLVGLLMARFLGFGGAAGEQSTSHFVVIDDTPSMADSHRDEGAGFDRDALATARQAVEDDIIKPVANLSGVQSLTVYRLSDVDTPFTAERINETTRADLKNWLADTKPATVHANIRTAYAKVKEAVDRVTGQKRLYLVSDFRASDFAGAGSGTKEGEAKTVGFQTYLLDAAHPPRKEGQAVALYHDNLGIVDLQPESRVVAKSMPVDFNLTVANFSNAERKNVRIAVRVNDQAREDASISIPSLRPGVTTTTFVVPSFDRLGSKERPLDKYNVVSASIENDEGGLAFDNKRYAVVEAREKVPLLVIEGDPTKRGKPESDAYYLQALFKDSIRGYEFNLDGPGRLESGGLDGYASVFLLNVGKLSPKAVEVLQKYVREGGGLAFFMGPECRPELYNALYDDGKGLFPLPLANAPTEEPADEEKILRGVYHRSTDHPVLRRIYDRDDKARQNDEYLKFVATKRYFPPRDGWKRPTDVAEVLTLPSTKTIEAYKDELNRLIEGLGRATDAVAAKSPGYVPALRRHYDALTKERFAGGNLGRLSDLIDAMLREKSVSADTPDLQVFWQAPEQAELREGFDTLKDRMRFGDPLVLAKPYGKGKVVAYLSTAGAGWNNFPNFLAQPYYVMLMHGVQLYLVSTPPDANRTLGQGAAFTQPSDRATNRVRRYRVSDGDKVAGLAGGREELGEQVAPEAKAGLYEFAFSETKKPGVYLFEFPQLDAMAQPDVAAQAFNVDTNAEGDLRRVGRDDLLLEFPNSKLHNPSSAGGRLGAELSQRQGDFSESPWFYLLLVTLLLAEQALATRLSFLNQAPTDAVGVPTGRA